MADVAAAVHLHPSTAAAVFRRAMGVSIGEYLAQCRVAEAQRLLISTDATTARSPCARGSARRAGSTSGSCATAACPRALPRVDALTPRAGYIPGVEPTGCGEAPGCDARAECSAVPTPGLRSIATPSHANHTIISRPNA